MMHERIFVETIINEKEFFGRDGSYRTDSGDKFLKY
jgi:hypothetical protein